MDPRAEKLAKVLVEHSTKVQKGDNVVISASDFSSIELIKECYKLCLQKGANVHLDILGINYEIGRADIGGLKNIYFENASDEQLEVVPEIMDAKINWGNKFIRITSIQNKNFLSNVKGDKLSKRQKVYYPVFDKMINKSWILTYFPTIGMAQNAKMSLDEFEDFYYKVCLADPKEMKVKLNKLQEIFDAGEWVYVNGKDTDIKFGIKGRFATNGDEYGIHNIPDGECFMGPVEDKTEGVITFELPQIYSGNEVSGIKLEFEKGKVVKYSAESGEEFLKQMLEDHEGNKRVGEFAVGVNYGVTQYMKDILFDEKMGGTVHMAMGNSYDEKRGGGKNKGTIHWDMIKDLRYKGTSVKVDDMEIMKNGKLLV